MELLATQPSGAPWAVGLERGTLSSRTYRPLFSHPLCQHYSLVSPQVVKMRLLSSLVLSPAQGSAAAQETHLPEGRSHRCLDDWPGLGRARSLGLSVSPSPTPSGGAATRKESETAGRLSRTRGRGGGPAERVEALVILFLSPFLPFLLSTSPPSVPQSPGVGVGSWEEVERCYGLRRPLDPFLCPPPPSTMGSHLPVWEIETPG